MMHASTHFVGEKVKALCFLKDVRAAQNSGLADAAELLPLVAVGGWDSGANSIALYLPVVASADEDALRREFGAQPHCTTANTASSSCELTHIASVAVAGDVHALRFASIDGANVLASALSTGTIATYKPREGDGALIPNVGWCDAFSRAATCLDVSVDQSTLVAASESGQVGWFSLEEGAGKRLVSNGDSSQLAIHGIKVLGRGSRVATVGAAPGTQLRVWDINANEQFPVLTAGDPHKSATLTSLETHPTRPELLITGSDDGHISFWDQRRLDAPIRSETSHQKAVRALTLHQTAPRFLFSGSDDATVLSWDFHHGLAPNEAVEYEKHGRSRSLQVQPLTSGFLPWNAIDVHAGSDTLIAGSEAQSLLLVRRASRVQHYAP